MYHFLEGFSEMLIILRENDTYGNGYGEVIRNGKMKVKSRLLDQIGTSLQL